MDNQPMTTLAEICAAGPCPGGIHTLLKYLGKTMTEAREDDTPLPIVAVLDSNGFADALWVLERAAGMDRICRLFAADCAERVLPIFLAERPDDGRPAEAIRVARDPEATDEQRAAAVDAAERAARAFPYVDARAAWAAWAARGAANGAAWAARAAEVAGAWDAQERRLRQYLTHGAAAQHMPWAGEDAASSAVSAEPRGTC